MSLGLDSSDHLSDDVSTDVFLIEGLLWFFGLFFFQKIGRTIRLFNDFLSLATFGQVSFFALNLLYLL